MTTQDTGVFNATGSFDSLDDGAEAILKRWVDAGSLSTDDGGAKKPQVDETDLEDDNETDDEEGNTDEETDGSDDADQDEGSDEGDDSDEEEDVQPTKAGDDALVEVTIDGETRTVSVKDLKRLYGQEASLTRKSQEVAEHRKKAEETGAKHAAALQLLVERANKKFEPYANVDWLVAQQQLDPDDFASLRQQAKEAHDEIQYLNTEVDNFVKQNEARRREDLQAAAKEAIADITNPESPNHIKDWSQDIYNDIRSYAVKEGLPETEVNQVVNPTVLKLLYKAMRYDKATKEVVTKKKALSPKKVMKSDKKSANITNKNGEAQEVAKKFKSSGTVDDAVELMLARWKSQAED
ncbi:hypothetical protein [Tardibacter chloracetimidivorans]|nr:hypothetical protein [Tardibacter chloracetimidivorans]